MSTRVDFVKSELNLMEIKEETGLLCRMIKGNYLI